MIKPIETIYNGYRFRSRLEARWAVFFDTLGVKYEYEKEGYDLDGVRYLPDFWLPSQKWWIEIKSSGGPTTTDWEKCARLAEKSMFPVAVLVGEIGNHHPYVNVLLPEWGEKARVSTNMFWLQCPRCNATWLSYDRRGDRLPNHITCQCTTSLLTENSLNGRRLTDLVHPGLEAAYTAARQARFEHGEHGR